MIRARGGRRLPGVALTVLALAGAGCSSGKGSSPPTTVPLKRATVTFPVKQALVQYFQANSMAPVKAKAKAACVAQHLDDVDVVVVPSDGSPSGTFSFVCKDL